MSGALLKNARVKRMSELPVALAGEVVMTADSADVLSQLRLWEQGDASMYTRDALEARHRNRSDPQVWKYLNAWWCVAMGSAKPSMDAIMPKEVYVGMYVRVCKALLEDGEAWDEQEAIRLVEGGWHDDSRGTGRLTRTMFNDGLFELADMWTLTTEASEYADFLKRLLSCVADGVQVDMSATATASRSFAGHASKERQRVNGDTTGTSASAGAGAGNDAGAGAGTGPGTGGGPGEQRANGDIGGEQHMNGNSIRTGEQRMDGEAIGMDGEAAAPPTQNPSAVPPVGEDTDKSTAGSGSTNTNKDHAGDGRTDAASVDAPESIRYQWKASQDIPASVFHDDDGTDESCTGSITGDAQTRDGSTVHRAREIHSGAEGSDMYGTKIGASDQKSKKKKKSPGADERKMRLQEHTDRRAAVAIQTKVRTKKVKKEFEQQKKAAVTIEKHARARKDRKDISSAEREAFKLSLVTLTECLALTGQGVKAAVAAAAAIAEHAAAVSDQELTRAWAEMQQAVPTFIEDCARRQPPPAASWIALPEQSRSTLVKVLEEDSTFPGWLHIQQLNGLAVESSRALQSKPSGAAGAASMSLVDINASANCRNSDPISAESCSPNGSLAKRQAFKMSVVTLSDSLTLVGRRHDHELISAIETVPLDSSDATPRHEPLTVGALFGLPEASGLNMVEATADETKLIASGQAYQMNGVNKGSDDAGQADQMNGVNTGLDDAGQSGLSIPTTISQPLDRNLHAAAKTADLQSGCESSQGACGDSHHGELHAASVPPHEDRIGGAEPGPIDAGVFDYEDVPGGRDIIDQHEENDDPSSGPLSKTRWESDRDAVTRSDVTGGGGSEWPHRAGNGLRIAGFVAGLRNAKPGIDGALSARGDYAAGNHSSKLPDLNAPPVASPATSPLTARLHPRQNLAEADSTSGVFRSKAKSRNSRADAAHVRNPRYATLSQVGYDRASTGGRGFVVVHNLSSGGPSSGAAVRSLRSQGIIHGTLEETRPMNPNIGTGSRSRSVSPQRSPSSPAQKASPPRPTRLPAITAQATEGRTASPERALKVEWNRSPVRRLQVGEHGRISQLEAKMDVDLSRVESADAVTAMRNYWPHPRWGGAPGGWLGDFVPLRISEVSIGRGELLPPLAILPSASPRSRIHNSYPALRSRMGVKSLLLSTTDAVQGEAGQGQASVR